MPRASQKGVAAGVITSHWQLEHRRLLQIYPTVQSLFSSSCRWSERRTFECVIEDIVAAHPYLDLDHCAVMAVALMSQQSALPCACTKEARAIRLLPKEGFLAFFCLLDVAGVLRAFFSFCPVMKFPCELMHHPSCTAVERQVRNKGFGVKATVPYHTHEFMSGFVVENRPTR